MTMINYTLCYKNGKPVKMYNLSGRTQKQQEAVECKLKKQGSLWGNFEILHQFIFTRKELNKVERAKKTLRFHKKKLNTLI